MTLHVLAKFLLQMNHNTGISLTTISLKKNRDDGYGGVAIALKKHAKFQKLNYSSDSDILIIKTKNFQPNLVICAVNFPPRVLIDDFKSEISRLLSCLEHHENVLILGDFNARARVWGDQTQSCRGNNLCKIILEHNFWHLNNGEYTFKNDILSTNGCL